MRKFINGNPDLIAKVQAEAVMVAFMNGDGCQAPGAAVVRKVRDTAKGDSFDEYAVHFANTQCGGYHGGSYSKDLAGAIEAFTERCTRYDPDGTRRASYIEGTGVDRELEVEA